MTTTRTRESQARIVSRCEEHLQKEIELLQEHLEASNSIQERLGGKESPDDRYADQWIEYASRKTAALAEERNTLRSLIASFLAVTPQQATVRLLISQLDEPVAAGLKQQFDTIHELDAVIQQRNRTNTLLIRQTMDLYQKIALELASPGPAAHAYTPAGKLAVSECGSFLRKDC
jgi:flagellar biosynthesis/type III secretory pathway chaperone